MRLEEEFLKELFDHGVLYLSGEITGGMAERFGKALALINVSQRFDEVKMIIDSHGGSVVAGLQMYEAIRDSKIPVHGLVYRRAFSMAAIVLQACSKRAAYSTAEVLFHDTTAEVVVTDNDEEIREKLKYARERLEMCHRIIASRMGRPMEEAAKFCRLDMTMSATEALERGLIDEIIELIP